MWSLWAVLVCAHGFHGIRPSPAPPNHLIIIAETKSTAPDGPAGAGFCGLVKICDDEAFTTLEQGFIGRPRESRLPSHIANTPGAKPPPLEVSTPSLTLPL